LLPIDRRGCQAQGGLLLAPVKAQHQPALLVGGLGAAQLIAWGTLYYAIAVLAEPIGAELGLSSSHVFGAFAWSMVIAGVLAPWAGRTLDRYGGRVVLASSAIVGAVGFLVLAHTHSFVGIVGAWSIHGVAMALGLYDTCFAAIGHVAPTSYRRTVTGVTLVAGFASTISWPATHLLVTSAGWRTGCNLYAAALLSCAPVYALVLPDPIPNRTARLGPKMIPVEVNAEVRQRVRVLAWVFAGTAVVSASLSAHLVGVLKALQLPSNEAIYVAASVGVMQVAGRLLELAFGARLHPARLGFVTFAGLFVAMILLLAVRTLPFMVYAFALVYGVTNGLLTIAKATLPVEIFGFARVGAVLGAFSAPSVVTRALAPFGFAVAMGSMGVHEALIGMVVISLAAGAAYTATICDHARRAPAPKEA
jgi:hypothetical protein